METIKQELRPEIQPEETLETLFSELEEILKEMETDSPTLERAITLYNNGMCKLAACHEKIDTAEKQLIVLQEQAQENTHV